MPSTRQAFLSETFTNSLFQLGLQEGRNMLLFLRQDTINQAGLQRYIDQRFPFRNRPPLPDKNPLDQTQPVPVLGASYSAAKSTITIADGNGIIQATNQSESFPINENIFDLLSPTETSYLADVLDQVFFGEIEYLYKDRYTNAFILPAFNNVINGS